MLRTISILIKTKLTRWRYDIACTLAVVELIARPCIVTVLIANASLTRLIIISTRRLTVSAQLTNRWRKRSCRWWGWRGMVRADVIGNLDLAIRCHRQGFEEFVRTVDKVRARSTENWNEGNRNRTMELIITSNGKSPCPSRYKRQLRRVADTTRCNPDQRLGNH